MEVSSQANRCTSTRHRQVTVHIGCYITSLYGSNRFVLTDKDQSPH